MTISSIYLNPISPLSAQVAGFTPPSGAKTLSLEMYRFVIESIRTADAQDGDLFLKRYFEGPQAVWEATHGRIWDLQSLWSAVDCPEALLPYLKMIVGWTPDFREVTDGLDALGLRRLIANSAPLFSARGPESTIRGMLGLMTGARTRVLNWFDGRMLVGETSIAAALALSNPAGVAVVCAPGGSGAVDFVTTSDHQRLYVRIADDGTLDHALVRGLVGLMRPTGERVEIGYVSLLDLFEVDNDHFQWGSHTATIPTVSGGSAKLSGTGLERVHAVVPHATDWTNYVATLVLTGTGRHGVEFYSLDALNYYDAVLDAAADTVEVRRTVAGVTTTLASAPLGGPVLLAAGHAHSVRVSVATTLSGTLVPTNTVEVYVDGTLALAYTDTLAGIPAGGSVGFRHEAGGTVEVYEVEVAQVPMTTDVLDINS